MAGNNANVSVKASRHSDGLMLCSVEFPFSNQNERIIRIKFYYTFCMLRRRRRRRRRLHAQQTFQK